MMAEDDMLNDNPLLDSIVDENPIDGISFGKEDGDITPQKINEIDERFSEEHEDALLKDPDLTSERLESKKKNVPLRFNSKAVQKMDPKVSKQQELISSSKPKSELEIALYDELKRKDTQIERLTGEVLKLKQFVSKRKQVYKRKRKDNGAPTRALSAYNIFVQDRFERLAKENEEALKSVDSDAKLLRVPPARLVASTGNEWKELPAEEKARYEERAKADKKRYEEEMAKYEAPYKQSNKKRNKTGYNMFFTYHVNSLKNNTHGNVPSERGSVARLVGNAWKELSHEQRQHFEHEADKENGVQSDGEDNTSLNDEDNSGAIEYTPTSPAMAMDPASHRQMMPPQMGHAPVVHQPLPHHDSRMQFPPHHGPPYYPPPPPGYYDFPHTHFPHAPPHGPPQPQQDSSSRQDHQEGEHQIPPHHHHMHSLYPLHPAHGYLHHHHPFHPLPHHGPPPPHFEQR